MNRRDPLVGALTIAAVLVAAGFTTIVLGYRIVARTITVAAQVPALVSGGLVGMALILTGCVIAVVQVGRACAARDREETDDVISAAREVRG